MEISPQADFCLVSWAESEARFDGLFLVMSWRQLVTLVHVVTVQTCTCRTAAQ